MSSVHWRLVPLAAVLLALSACGPGKGGPTSTAPAPASGVTTPTDVQGRAQPDDLADPVAGSVVSEAEVRRIDTALYAENFDISVEDADTQIRQREALQSLLDEADAHENFADAWIDRTDGFRMFIAFSGGVPAGFADAAPEYADTLTLVGDAPYTLEELREQANVLTQQLLAAGFGDFGTALDGRAGTIHLSIGLVTAASGPVPPAALAPNVELTVQSGPTSVDEGDG